MIRNLSILAAAALVLALPFVLRSCAGGERRAAADSAPASAARPVLTLVTPHNEAIRDEFGRAFSAWHARKYGVPVEVRWIAIGGTTEIARYLEGQYVSAARAWWRRRGHPWPAGAGEVLLNGRFDTAHPPGVERQAGEGDAALARRTEEAKARWAQCCELHRTFRATDDPAAFTSRLDLFFGGGQYDHQRTFNEGLSVPPWPPERAPAGLFAAADGTVLMPESTSGEIWRTPVYFANALSTFGLCYNLDRIRELGVPVPAQWADLAAPAYFRTLGLADPTKSGSIAKAFEMIVHQQCGAAVRRAGFDDAAVERFERAIAAAKRPPGEMPEGVPAAYQAAVEQGWLEGVRLIRRIGANARYFSDSSSKVPVDVSAGQAAAGLAIDFYARFQAQSSRGPDGRERMGYVTPAGGSSVTADPISLLRGAEHRALAVRFIEFVLGEEGQRLWTYRPGTPGGPVRFALRRLPVRRDFYPSENPAVQAAHERHRANAADDLASPQVDPYAQAKTFVYRPRWTGGHFGLLRDLVKAMCLDSLEELQAAQAAIVAHGGPERQPEAMAQLDRMPAQPRPLDWGSALELSAKGDRLEYLRDWTMFFRESYRRAASLVK